MSKEGIVIDGVVVDCLPNATFRVQITGQSYTILAHLSGRIRINNINISTNDRVRLEMSPYDLTKGRITFRYKD